MSHSPTDFDAVVPGEVVASFLGLSLERVRQLAEEGVLPRQARGKFPLRPCVVAYCEWQRDEQRKANKSAAASRVQDARARDIELRIAEKEGRLVDMVEHLDLFSEAFGIVKTGLAGVPVRVTRDADLRRKIETEIDDVLAKAASRFEEGTANIRAAGAAAAAIASDDAGRMGGGE